GSMPSILTDVAFSWDCRDVVACELCEGDDVGRGLSHSFISHSATRGIDSLSLHGALPICRRVAGGIAGDGGQGMRAVAGGRRIQGGRARDGRVLCPEARAASLALEYDDADVDGSIGGNRERGAAERCARGGRGDGGGGREG